MSHPIPDPNPTALLLNRMRATTVALADHPETYNSRTLSAILHASLELTKATNAELAKRAKL